MDLVERLGERTLIYARLADGHAVTAEDVGHSRVKIGDKISLKIDGSQAHVFDASGAGYHRSELVSSARDWRGLLFVAPFVLLYLLICCFRCFEDLAQLQPGRSVRSRAFRSGGELRPARSRSDLPRVADQHV